MQPDLVISLDSSTTACKAIVWDRSGRETASGRAAVPLMIPQPAWHEQPAESWWQAACQALQEAVREIDPGRLAGISISIQRETFVLADGDGIPLRPALVWMDERARGILPELITAYGGDRFHGEAGKPLSANLVPAKLAWIRQYEPQTFARTRLVLDVFAYLAGRFTGRYATGNACVDPGGLYDMANDRWNVSLLNHLGLSTDYLPEVLPVGAWIGDLTREAAAQTGMPAGLPLFAGLGDGQAAGLGVNATSPGDAYLNLGTAVVSGVYTSAYRTAPAFRTHFSGVPGSFFLETVLLGGTYTITWLVDRFLKSSPEYHQPGKKTEEILEAAGAEIPPGAEGLILLPYWNSVLNPYWDPGASGVVAGWRGHHGLPHLYRAILEGIAFEQRLATSGVEDVNAQPVERYISVGGGSQSALWRQIIADVTGKPVLLSSSREASALGAAMAAAYGAGWFPDLPAAARGMASIQPGAALPDPNRHAFYTRLYDEVYCHLFPSLQPYLDRLTLLSDPSKE